ncbi:flagellar biosynthesis protein FliQ [Achromobacter sp. 413638]|uniref:flagellar biosynthesis protein FliQ n=1 Tax=Achromobacter sp. 413638 TaxID=3342385 RepID=UPI00370B448F
MASSVPQGARRRRMRPDLAIQLMSDLFWTGLLICAPVLLLTLTVGVVISILQVVTQVQEMSLTFIPKIVAAVIAMALFGPWMLRTLMQYATALLRDMPGIR